MLIDARAFGFSMTEPILRHVESRVELALGHFAHAIARVRVRLDDVNGDRGGPDKRCSVIVRLRRSGEVVAETVDQDLYRAITDATLRVRRSVQRALTRHRAVQRRDPQRPGAMLV